jgi:CHASE3 domain sensor protein
MADPIERQVIIAFLLAGLWVGSLGAATWLATNRLRAAARDVARSRESSARLQARLSAMTEAETAMRGFVLCGAKTFLSPYRADETVGANVEAGLNHREDHS